MEKYEKRIRDYLQGPYWVIDVLPKQVSKESRGQFFAVEDYFLHDDRLAAIKEKHINIVLKLNCYYPVSLNQKYAVNPPLFILLKSCGAGMI